ncbi:MAG TPA: hypothetical protein VK789_08505 [Bryobacteraceae bacterium]|nr:hypothetical protein [Bryobacteraceae bacterium]
MRASLDEMDQSKIPNSEEIEACLESADRSFKEALGYSRPPVNRLAEENELE